MNPADCPDARKVTAIHVTCEKFCAAAGFTCSVLHNACDVHEKAGGPDVPIDDVPALRARLTGLLKARIIGGDSPAYQGANPVMLDDAFAKFAARATKQEQGEVLIGALERWREIGVDKEGHQPEVIERKIQKMAKDHGLEDVLDAWTESMAP